MRASGPEVDYQASLKSNRLEEKISLGHCLVREFGVLIIPGALALPLVRQLILEEPTEFWQNMSALAGGLYFIMYIISRTRLRRFVEVRVSDLANARDSVAEFLAERGKDSVEYNNQEYLIATTRNALGYTRNIVVLHAVGRSLINVYSIVGFWDSPSVLMFFADRRLERQLRDAIDKAG